MKVKHIAETLPITAEPRLDRRRTSICFSLKKKVDGDDISYPVSAPWLILLHDEFYELHQIVCGNDNALHQYNRWHIICLLFNSHFITNIVTNVVL